jgi:hypothetical protein
MAYHGMSINGTDLLTTYGLILGADLEIAAPALRSSRVIIPGRDGSLNLSYALTGAPVYDDRVISGSLLKQADDSTLDSTRRTLLSSYHGREVDIVLPVDTTHVFRGVIEFGGVPGFNKGTIKWSMVAEPYRLKLTDTEVTKNLTTTEQTFTIANEARPVVPTITVSTETTVKFGNGTFVLSSGAHVVPDIMLQAGNNTIKAKTSSGTGTMKLTYREGVL